MKTKFAAELKRLRTEQGLSQQQLADKLFVDRSSVAHWENGRRIPDALLLTRIANTLGIDVGLLLNAATDEEETKPKVLVIDDEKIILKGEMASLEKVLTDVSITGFSDPEDALAYIRTNNVSVVFTDIELKSTNGLDLCRRILDINPRINVIFITAYSDYSIDAWSTGASGFIVKPITEDAIRKQLALLRFPIPRLSLS